VGSLAIAVNVIFAHESLDGGWHGDVVSLCHRDSPPPGGLPGGGIPRQPAQGSI
jgi:hypothetical protein